MIVELIVGTLMWCGIAEGGKKVVRDIRMDFDLARKKAQCRKCGSLVTSDFQSDRGVAAYNCECGHGWTIRW